MSGTRLNSKIEDLAASITVVTKQQMSDFAMLDINDIFTYEAGTEGTGNFTDFSFNRNGTMINNAQLDPNTANRIRGVGTPNITIGNFEASGILPIDPLNIDAVEISRGPNAAIFGIGNAAGTVNTVPAAANLTRNKSQVTLRADTNEGYRATLDLNRVLIPGKLAIRGSAARQRDGFQLKPSGVDTNRYNAMVRYRPFRRTMLSASYSYYDLAGNRPNMNTPVDVYTPWRASGSPTHDAFAETMTRNSVTTPRDNTVGSPNYFFAYFANPQAGGSVAYIDQSGLGYFGVAISTLSNNPNTGSLSQRLYDALGDPSGARALQPLFPKWSPLTDKAIYDYTSINLSALNFNHDRVDSRTVTLDQMILDTARQTLAVQLAYFHEGGTRFAHSTLGGDTRQGGVIGIAPDVESRMLDGSPNPYFLRPFVQIKGQYDTQSVIDRNTYRGQLAYKIDLTGEKNWTRWLGMHQVTGYGEYKEWTRRGYAFSDVITDDHTWAPAGILRSGLGSGGNGLASGPAVLGPTYRWYLGDAVGGNVEYAPTQYARGTYPLHFGNAGTGYVTEPVRLGEAALNFSGGGSNEWRIAKSRGGVLQSHLLKDRLVLTLGARHDELYTRPGRTLRYQADGAHVDDESYTSWSLANWASGKGPTYTKGVVFRPLPWINLFANQSNSFVPASPAQNLFLERLPYPAGRGQDAGIAFNFFQGKLNMRFNQYVTNQLKSRGGDSGTAAGRVTRLDFTTSTTNDDAFRLQNKATEWVTAAAAVRGAVLTADQILTEVSAIMKLPKEYLVPTAYPISAVNDIRSSGKEVEINYNPSDFWTMKLNATEQVAINKNLSPEVNQWIAQRMAVWTTIMDPIEGTPWFTTRYRNQQTASDWLAQNVVAPLVLAQAQEGKSRPQIRKYRANFSTNYRLAGISENRHLKRMSVGGALRWEDKGAIGYYGVETMPTIVTRLDPNRPVYDKGHYYMDAFVGYRAPFFSKKVTATWQLNIRNLNENGRLQPIGAMPDGTKSAYRIIDPRLFILSATFDM